MSELLVLDEALEHPNICTVYEINEVDGQMFIGTAYVEGQSHIPLSSFPGLRRMEK